MEFTGTIAKIKNIERPTLRIISAKIEGGKGFQKRGFCWQIANEKYLQAIALEFHRDKVMILLQKGKK